MVSRPAEGTVKQHMERRRRQPFLATDNVGNFHQVVVDDVSQVVSRQVVGTFVEHLIVAEYRS